MIQGSTQDYFTQEELIQIYQDAGGAERNALLAAAQRLFPERMVAENRPFLLVEEGIHGRWFVLDPDAPAEAPQYTIKSGHCSWIGILQDGTALPY